MWRLLIIIFIFLILQEQVNSKEQLYFSFITSKTGGFVVSGVIPMIQYALEEINNSTSILNNYTLNHGEIFDSQCNGAQAMNGFMEQFMNDSQPKFIALVGCGSSAATIPVAELSHYWNIPHVSFSAAAKVLADKTRFKSFYQVLPSYSYMGPALTGLALTFKWTQMSVIAQPVDVFSGVAIDMKDLFNRFGLKLDTTIRSTPFDKTTKKIFNWGRNDYRIIFINAYHNFAYAVLCEAYRLNMFYPKYIWITQSSYVHKWWLAGTGNSSCPPSHVEKVLNGSLAMEPIGMQPYRKKSYKTSNSKMTAGLFERLYDGMLEKSEYTHSTVVGPAYDSIWALAIGLELASQRIAINNDTGCETVDGELVSLEEFEYSNKKMGCILQKSLSHVKFNGITGAFKFDNNKTRQSNRVLFTQYRWAGEVERFQLVPVFKIDCLDNFNCKLKFVKNNSLHTVWGGVPHDGSTDKVIRSYFLPMRIIFTLIAIIGIMFALICFVFNITFKKRTVVKMSSPNLNNLIILGAVLTYIAIFCTVHSFTGFNQTIQQTLLCNLHYWLSSIGYTMCFAVVLVKSWRAYYIFGNPNAKKQFLKDWTMLILILIIVSIDVLLLIIGSLIPFTRITAVLTIDEINPLTTTDDGSSTLNYVYLCNNSILLGVSICYKAILQVAGVYLAFHTRQIKLRSLNDSRQMAALILVNSLLITALVAATFSAPDNRDITISMEGIVLTLQATIFLGMIFVPNMIALYVDPNGEKVLESRRSGTVINMTSLALAAVSAQGAFVQLHKRIKQLEDELAKSKTQVVDIKEIEKSPFKQYRIQHGDNSNVTQQPVEG